MGSGIVFRHTLIFIVVFTSAAYRKALGQTLCNPSTRFVCHDGVCISKAKVCDKNPDCPGGEDEENCPENASESCYTRNETMARANGYICRRACDPTEGCRARNKKCICDDECGYSCINKWATCSGQPLVANSSGFEIRQRLGTPESEWYHYFGATIRYNCLAGMQLKGPMPRCTGRKIWSAEVPQCVDVICRAAVPNVTNTVSSRFLRPTGHNFIPVRDNELPMVNDIIEYKCDRGLLRMGNPPTCGEDLQWTPNSIRCVVTCFEQRNSDLITSQNLTCGRDCDTSADCSTGEECHCDGICGRVCVDPDADCGEAQEVTHASLNYTGSGVKKIARYSCDVRYYLRTGSLSVYCSVTGIWVGDAPVCEAIFCGDPGPSIRASGGFIYSYGGLHFGAIVEFKCRQSHRLLGSRTRKCMGDGKWSGQLAVCDRRDNIVRCPNPGVPINGNTVRVSRENFAINSTVRFQCDSGHILVGDELQTCLWFKQWSGHSTPLCIDPKYPQSAPDAIGTLSRSLANLPTREESLGRSLLSHETDRTHEVYFLFDVSESVLKRPRDLQDEIHFAKRFVRRMENFGGMIKYGIMVFASANFTAMDISDERARTTDDVLDALDQIYNNAPNKTYKSTTRSGTATGEALDKLEDTIAFMNGRNKIRNPHGKKTKRHVFIFTDGKHTEGEDPVKKREKMEKQFRPNIEFYSITACKRCNENDIRELTGLASLNEKGKKNYIYIDDFYQLSTYLDQVTDLEYDFSKCGQAGDVGSIKLQASLGRAAGGEDAAENAWPWQVFITGKKGNKKVEGGGSILNQNWILSAAHVLKAGREFRVTAGMFERTAVEESVSTSIQMCQAEQFYIHPNYSDQNFHNDIALIKLGSRIDPVTLSPITNVAPGFTYTYYVRPVCLPCTGSCLQRSQLTDNDERLVLESMTNEEICREEEKLLIDPTAKTVVTGFGHYKKTDLLGYPVEGANSLQQALLQIADDETCRTGISDINEKLDTDTYSFSNSSMFCCQSWTSDACQGDSGGPVVREVLNKESESCWIQIGIVSFGYGCQRGNIPGFYTNVARYIPWLQKIAGNETVPNT